MKRDIKTGICSVAVGLLLTSALAQAGTGSSGGGDAIVCLSDRLFYLPLPTGTNAWLADTFTSQNERGARFNPRMTDKELDEAIFIGLNQVDAGLGKKVAAVLKTLKFVPAGELPDLPDDYINLSGKAGVYCRKHQLAVQHNKGTRDAYVEVNQELHGRLSNFEKRLFRVHEALISLHPNYSDTTDLRQKVARAANGQAMLGTLLGKVGAKKPALPKNEDYARVFAFAVGEASKTDPRNFYLYMTSNADFKFMDREEVNGILTLNDFSMITESPRYIQRSGTVVKLAVYASYFKTLEARSWWIGHYPAESEGTWWLAKKYVLALAAFDERCAKNMAGKNAEQLVAISFSGNYDKRFPDLPNSKYYRYASTYAAELGKYLCTQSL